LFNQRGKKGRSRGQNSTRNTKKLRIDRVFSDKTKKNIKGTKRKKRFLCRNYGKFVPICANRG